MDRHWERLRHTLRYGFLAALSVVTFASCASVELEQKTFPLFCAVKVEDGAVEICYEPYAEQKQLDYNHLKVLVFEEAFLEDTARYDELLEQIQKEDTYPRNTYVCVTADTGALMQIADVIAEELGEYLEELLENADADEVAQLPTIGKLIDEKENKRKTLYLPYLVVDGTSVIWDGTYCIRQSVPQGVTQESAQRDATEQESAQQDPLQPGIAQKILRFHVIANSDSGEDQEVKLKVRDAVGALMEEKLAQVNDLAESKAVISENLENIRAIAQDTLRKAGADYGADAWLATVEFPEKSYGAFTFPAGEYEALEVVLGEGTGQNWWCVLYPNLCFRGSVYEVVDEDAKEELREVLTPEEYADVIDSGRFVIRLKFLEYFRKNS
jgi:stage II sporulation protein R